MIESLPPRERQVFEALFAMKRATAAELEAAIRPPLSNSALRVMLRRLEGKGFVTHEEEQGRFIYAPALPDTRIKQNAVQRFVETYFGGSPLGAATALLGMSKTVSAEEIEKLEEMLAKVRKEQGK